jgi:hypothetical protein
MLGAQYIGAGRDIFRATPAVTQNLGFSEEIILLGKKIVSNQYESI